MLPITPYFCVSHIFHLSSAFLLLLVLSVLGAMATVARLARNKSRNRGVFHAHIQQGAITVWTAAGATFTGSLSNTGTEWEE